MHKKSFDSPDETHAPPKSKVEIVKINGGFLARMNFEPGWKWSEDMKPDAGTKTCQMHHVLCAVSGQLNVVMDDGTENEVGPGDVLDIPPGHDAWVVGDKAFVGIDVANI